MLERDSAYIYFWVDISYVKYLNSDMTVTVIYEINLYPYCHIHKKFEYMYVVIVVLSQDLSTEVAHSELCILIGKAFF